VGLVVDGSPVLLVENGHWHEDRMAKLHLRDHDVMASARLKGLLERKAIRHAVHERNGSIAVIGFESREEAERHD
jgi:uncharacterized membrane protein YcaP (DUF421 family)